jgi:hypothetical protein
MDDVPEVYHRPHSNRRPVVSLVQFIGEVIEPTAAAPGKPGR